MSKLPFDRINVVIGGDRSDYAVGDFLRLPLNARVKSILFGKLTFSNDGQPVDTNQALNALRKLGTE